MHSLSSSPAHVQSLVKRSTDNGRAQTTIVFPLVAMLTICMIVRTCDNQINIKRHWQRVANVLDSLVKIT